MKRIRGASHLVPLAITVAALQTPTVLATDAVAAGYVTDVTYRENYVMFQLVNGGANSCSPCPGDPGGFTGGKFCWIPATSTAQLALLLSAQAQGLMVSGRVDSLAADCTVYQMTIVNG